MPTERNGAQHCLASDILHVDLWHATGDPKFAHEDVSGLWAGISFGQQKVFAGQVGPMDAFALGEWMACRHCYKYALTPERTAHQTPIGGLPNHDRDIEQAILDPGQQHIPIAFKAGYFDLGVAFAELAERCPQVAGGEGRIEAYGQLADVAV